MLDFTIPHVLRSDAEYEVAATELDRVLALGPKPGTAEHDRLEFLTVLIAAYDAQHVRFGETRVTPQEVVDFFLEQKAIARADLAKAMGGRSRVSDFFSGKRRLSLGQIREIRRLLGIPADMLIEDHESPHPDHR